VTLSSQTIEIDIVPGKGGDIIALRRRHDGLGLLWSSPWGLRPRGALSAASTSEGRLMEAYPGGWQTVFPNGGDATDVYNTSWGMHGEVWLTPFRWHIEENSIVMNAELVHSPFRIVKRITVDGLRVSINETITNRGGQQIETMWSHHPAFGAPLLSPDSIIETTAHTVLVDSEPEEQTDLEPGSTGAWPYAPGKNSGQINLSDIPPAESRLSRMAYLTDFTRGMVAIRNERLDTGIQLDWDSTFMPYAWYWLEAGGTSGFPWYQGVYVLGIEPATSIPGHGITKAHTTVAFEPAESKSTEVALTVTDGRAPNSR
jgi:hypothetical protein